jgi:hypothetical protein
MEFFRIWVENEENYKRIFKPADIQIDVKQTFLKGGPTALKSTTAQDATYKYMECIKRMRQYACK